VGGAPTGALSLLSRLRDATGPHPAGCGAPHDAGRSPLGAPPWRFSAGGRASISGIASGSVQRAPRSQVVVPGGRCPGPPEEKEAQTAFHIRYICQMLMKIGRSCLLRGDHIGSSSVRVRCGQRHFEALGVPPPNISTKEPFRIRGLTLKRASQLQNTRWLPKCARGGIRYLHRCGHFRD
jgi:hypothetical protein